MATQVNIGEAKTRLSELVAAAERGEEVTLARAGRPAVRLVAVAAQDAGAERARRRMEALGFARHMVGDADLSLAAIKADRVSYEERWEAKEARMRSAD